MSKATGTRIIDSFPPCAFGDFLQHMRDEDGTAWIWSFMEMTARFGVFYSSPENTIMARPVSSKLSEDDLMSFNDLDPNHPVSSSGLTSEPDTWHILYASGDPRFFFTLCPYPLPYLSWHRNKGGRRLRRYPFDKLKSSFHG